MGVSDLYRAILEREALKESDRDVHERESALKENGHDVHGVLRHLVGGLKHLLSQPKVRLSGVYPFTHVPTTNELSNPK